jgi:hypothetical protein
MTAAQPGEPGPGGLGRQLIRQAEAISQLRHDLDRLASEITDSVADLHSRLESTEDTASGISARSGIGAEPKGVMAWCWRYLGPQGSDALWAELAGWVGWIRHRYPLARRVPACWAQHPELVEELTALWLAWHASYTERDAPLTGPIDWHDRWLPGLLHRLEHGAFALNCSSGHQDRPASAYANAGESDSILDIAVGRQEAAP